LFTNLNNEKMSAQLGHNFIVKFHEPDALQGVGWLLMG
jgi:hypothetical protein